MSTVLISLIGLAVFVVAQSNDEDQISVSSNVEEGWNLVSNGIWAINPSQDSKIKIEDISAIYFYDSKDREYKRIYPLGALTHEEEEEVEDKIMKENAPAAWIYSKKSGNLKFMTDDVYPISQRPLYAGWNLVSITPSFVADNTLKSLDYMKGSCNILNAYFWNPENKKWIDIPLTEDLGDVLYYYDRLTGYGIVIKVSSDCTLGTSEATTSPPTIPN